MNLSNYIQKIILEEAFLMEALPLSTAKQYVSIERNPKIQQRLDDIFEKLSKIPNAKASRNQNRIYIPLKKKENGEKSDIENEISQVLSQNNYELSDYKKGLVKDKYGRETKIGKVLTKLNKQDLLNKFNTDKKRESSKNVDSYLVFSKHPYDVAGSSTDRGWSSCMNIFSGSNKKYIQHDIKEGTIVCYLISSNDLNINKPIARLLIKPFINVIDKDDVLYVPENKIYGTAPKTFKNQIVKIFEKFQNEKVGKFRLIDTLYCDSKSEVTILDPKIRQYFDGKKKPGTKEEVEKVLNILGIKNYKINEDLSVDVNGDADINEKKLKTIPIKFGKIDGNFSCHNNNLTSLQGAPASVGGGFDCRYNNLTSLQGAPASVGGGFDCRYNNLTSLQGAPASVGGGFYCSSNNLTSLQGAPASVGGGFYCSSNNLTSLQGAPESVGEDFNCYNNKLTSLQGAPESVGGYFACYNNNLTSLQGAPESVGGNFACYNNNLTSLQGAPESVGGNFSCFNNNLTSLQGAPKEVGRSFACSYNKKQFTEEEVRAVCKVGGTVTV